VKQPSCDRHLLAVLVGEEYNVLVRRSRRLALLAAVPLILASPAGARHEATITFSFQGYANNVRVRPPLVGRFQLGVARTRGSGTLTSSSTDGTLIGTNNPLDERYSSSSLRAEAIGYSYYQAAHAVYTKLTLTIQVVRTSGTANCEDGTRGTLTLYDSTQKLDNGQRSDYITVHWPAGRCPGFFQGWTNQDGGERTRPSYGGPPHGGQWAVVNVTIR
jgi:hypothetical protein